jgi:hypothetical protein
MTKRLYYASLYGKRLTRGQRLVLYIWLFFHPGHIIR